MTPTRPAVAAVAAAVLCAGALAVPAAQQNTDAITVPLSDPGRPALVRVNVMNGRITVRGENRKDVLVTSRAIADESRARARRQDPPSDGLQRLSQGGGVGISEENNQLSIRASIVRTGDVELLVPARTNLNLRGLNGDVIVENVEGEIEVNQLNGEIRLTNVAGSVVADSHGGNILVVLTRIAADKAMAFTSFNGNVDVTLPASTKANLKMRSDSGDIFTNFDVQLQPNAADVERRDGRGIRVQVNRSMYGTINGGGPEFELRTFNGNIYVRRGQ